MLALKTSDVVTITVVAGIVGQVAAAAGKAAHLARMDSAGSLERRT